MALCHFISWLTSEKSQKATHLQMYCISMLGVFLAVVTWHNSPSNLVVPCLLSAQHLMCVMSFNLRKDLGLVTLLSTLQIKKQIRGIGLIAGLPSYWEMETGLQCPIRAQHGLWMCCSPSWHAPVHTPVHHHRIGKSSVTWEIHVTFESLLPGILYLFVWLSDGSLIPDWLVYLQLEACGLLHSRSSISFPWTRECSNIEPQDQSFSHYIPLSPQLPLNALRMPRKVLILWFFRVTRKKNLRHLSKIILFEGGECGEILMPDHREPFQDTGGIVFCGCEISLKCIHNLLHYNSDYFSSLCTLHDLHIISPTVLHLISWFHRYKWWTQSS